MRRSISLIIVGSLVAGSLAAQDVKPAVSAGSKSLNFSFAGLGAFGIGPTGVGGGLGATYFLSSDAGVRIGLQLVYASSSTPANPPVGTPGKDGSQSAFQAAVGADYLMYLAGATSRVRPYMGAGVEFGFANTGRKIAMIGAGDQTEVKNSTGGESINGTTYFAGTMLSARAIAGAEFFLYPELSISAEYRLNVVELMSAADQEVITGPVTVTTKGGSATTLFGFGAVGAMLQIYF
jgi:outer membrane protein W